MSETTAAGVAGVRARLGPLANLVRNVVPSYAGPPRRYYRITSLGRDVLAAWRESWRSTRDFVDSVVGRPLTQENPS